VHKVEAYRQTLTQARPAAGPREPIEDPYGTWAELREISDSGVLLVRPDLYVAARHASAPDSPEAAAAWLTRALTSILGTSTPSTRA
jgi:2,4-dichlorophenol 6-monooxygenase